ncbi:hypothetical protein BM525_19415 (plasmid) [Alteromonas mediterranea]|uniref:Uncharacterized protein n=1 Tax=Alteromonas mediterranea TaxID=314275 RepID=A0AAC9JHV5_9ALTE|nr:hypothetical protein [Alteromonas mediterranea]APD92053.1 hypothetical protein BM524_19220 [Alteromonas mediterranea]APD99907.1 hypothetical protein BM525_19415 [Alteromonas mediterranea]
MNNFSLLDLKDSLNKPNHPFALAVAGVLQRKFSHSMPADAGVIAAGQAVSSAVLQLLKGDKAPFKDLDLFWLNGSNTPYPIDTSKNKDSVVKTFVEGREVVFEKTKRYLKNVGGTHEVSVYSDPSFGDIVHQDVIMNDYAILKTYNDRWNPLLNHILVGVHRLEDNRKNAKRIINAFDINCCQVALIPETMTLVATDAFLEFIDTYQLQVVSYNTPMHSAIRLEKKVKDLPFALVNLDDEISKLQTYRKMMMLFEAKRRDENHPYWPIYGNAFSQVYRERFLAASPAIREAFTIEEVPFEFENSYASDDAESPVNTIQVCETVTLNFLTPTRYDEAFIDAAPLVLDTLSANVSPVTLSSYIPFIKAIAEDPSLKPSMKFLLESKDGSGEDLDNAAAAVFFNRFLQLLPKINDLSAQNILDVIDAIKSFSLSHAGLSAICHLSSRANSLDDLLYMPTLVKSLEESGIPILNNFDALLEKSTVQFFPTSTSTNEWLISLKVAYKKQLLENFNGVERFPNYVPNIVRACNESLPKDVEIKCIETPRELVNGYSTSIAHFNKESLLAVVALHAKGSAPVITQLTLPGRNIARVSSYPFVQMWLIDEASTRDSQVATALTSLSEMLREQVTALLKQEALPYKDDIANYPYPINLAADNDAFDAFIETDEIPF